MENRKSNGRASTIQIAENPSTSPRCCGFSASTSLFSRSTVMQEWNRRSSPSEASEIIENSSTLSVRCCLLLNLHSVALVIKISLNRSGLLELRLAKICYVVTVLEIYRVRHHCWLDICNGRIASSVAHSTTLEASTGVI